MKIFITPPWLIVFSLPSLAAEVIKFTLFDGEVVEGKLSLPGGGEKIEELVIFVHGTELIH
jgi:hypothetical protein